ncbi:MAG: trypsin-like peptidase domain-containing protein, partial [Thermoleophilia bacterium]|nr:trypsin-like peptidase domain-containing protein [Thermoleophilia bacterium]
MLIIGFALACAAIAADARGAQAEPTAEERIQAYVEPSVVYVDTTWTAELWDTNVQGGEALLTEGDAAVSVSFGCTGFFVNPEGYIATAGHCVEYDDAVKSGFQQAAIDWVFENQPYPNQTFTRAQIEGFAANGDYAFRERKAKYTIAYEIATSGESASKTAVAQLRGLRGFERGDVALLDIQGEDFPALKLASERAVEIGLDLVSIGFAASVDEVTDVDLNPSYNSGSVTAKRTRGGGETEFYQIDAAVSSGMSGGPAVDLQGRVIGLNSFAPAREQQPFNFIAPASVVSEMLRDKGVENTLGATNAIYREGLNAYFAGERDEAIENLEEVLAREPSHELAGDYLRKARALPEEEDGLPILPIVLGLAALAVAGGVAALLLTRRRRAAADAHETATAGPAAQPPAAAPVPSER